MKGIIAAVVVGIGLSSAIVYACPEGYHKDCRTDPCAEKREIQRCVRWENGQCVDTRSDWVCVPRTVCTYEHN